MHIFKITKGKLILTVLLISSWYFYFSAQLFFGLSITSLEPCNGIMLGGEPTPTPPPLNIINTTQDLTTIFETKGNEGCAPAEGTSNTLATIIFYMLILVPAYLLSCILIFGINKMKKKSRIKK